MHDKNADRKVAPKPSKGLPWAWMRPRTWMRLRLRTLRHLWMRLRLRTLRHLWMRLRLRTRPPAASLPLSPRGGERVAEGGGRGRTAHHSRHAAGFILLLAATSFLVACDRKPVPESEAKPATNTRVLRVCADPNNLPFTNERLEGFENRIAEVIARDLDAKIEYTWWAQRRGFIRSTLRAGTCDVVLGIPSSFELALPTRPYYRSTYVFVTRADRNLHIETFDDPQLRELTVGVHLVGDDGANTPPAHALSNRGIINNVRGYTLYGDYREDSPPARMIEAVAKGEIDVAVAWGPLAGYHAPKQGVELKLVPVSPQIDLPFLPFVYDIAVGVRRGEEEFRDEIDAVLRRRQNEIAEILDKYGVPRVGARVSRAAL
jgi:mxaJ protein